LVTEPTPRIELLFCANSADLRGTAWRHWHPTCTPTCIDMPARAKTDTLQRLITLLKAIPTSMPGKETGDLLKALKGAGYELDVRSLQRDLVSLKKVLPLKCDDRARPHRWYWKEGDAAGVGALSTPEALALVLVEQYLTQALPAQMTASFKALFGRAHARLKALGPNNRQPLWLKKIRSISPILPVLRPTIDPRIQAVVAEAVMNERQLDVAYRSLTSDRPRSLRLNPLALILRGELLYLVATAKSHEDVRLYAVHRISEAQELRTPLARPPGFDIDCALKDGLGQFSVGPGPAQIELKLHCAPWLARDLQESPLAEGQTVQLNQDGSAIVCATVRRTWQLNWWVLARMESAEVMAPADFRKEIGDLLARGADRYRAGHMKRVA
jgi:predicted DNA-binding transcriptional regulator YafY